MVTLPGRARASALIPQPDWRGLLRAFVLKHTNCRHPGRCEKNSFTIYELHVVRGEAPSRPQLTLTGHVYNPLYSPGTDSRNGRVTVM